ncbi:hypothetical protein M1M07_22915 [Rhodococcus sp. HM1]|uniref:hypothetical protein n=1 Tax=Rhodococcus sp. HM1 TaxID=2937759 RepID=UPI00200B2E17|nr:hypothetical protein [Rhodococcus sp. HM1]MCK8673947.1 hypothetical protein [Rhodococcus sp. HM1]
MTVSSSAGTGLRTDPHTTVRGPTLSTGIETVAHSAHPIIASATTADAVQVEPNTIA